MKSALIWDECFTAYRFRPDHPFNPKRLELSVSLIEALGLTGGPGVVIVPPRPATDEELLRVHSPEFIAAVKRLGREGPSAPDDGCAWGLGTDDNPIFPGMHEATAMVVGGTLRAAEMVMSGEATRAFNIAGGLHHGHHARASGFCVYNDLAATIAWIREAHGARVLYVDYDAHHGDGVQALFYSDPEVLTLSIHESGRYLFPGTGFVDELGEDEGYGFSLNLPMEPFTEDGSWLESFSAILEDACEAFRPEVIVLQNGCDSHALDPLTHLRCTTRVSEESVRRVVEMADRFCEGRIIATGGGGYAIWQVVPRAWTLVWAALSGQPASNAIPREWLERWQGESPVLLPERLRDDPEAVTPIPRRAEIETSNRTVAASLRRSALPLLRGWSMGF
ncbi:MAG TPA: acetoin utilization protein AcuC [Longimicrobiaceae bacterium]|nr:acetoin utilization protein AcuC [Longimicrobiaceae bacterium]